MDRGRSPAIVRTFKYQTGTSARDAVSVAAGRERVCDTTVRGRFGCRLFAPPDDERLPSRKCPPTGRPSVVRGRRLPDRRSAHVAVGGLAVDVVRVLPGDTAQTEVGPGFPEGLGDGVD